MKRIYSVAGILALALLSFTSCEKEKTTPPADNKPQLTKEQMLSGTGSTPKSWTISKTYMNGTETTGSVKACSMDDLHIYKTGGVFEVRPGATKCNPAETDPRETAEWWFNNDKTRLNMKYTYNGQSTSFAYTIEEISETSLKLTMTYDGKNYTTLYSAK